jgi:hypothetical protein
MTDQAPPQPKLLGAQVPTDRGPPDTVNSRTFDCCPMIKPLASDFEAKTTCASVRHNPNYSAVLNRCTGAHQYEAISEQQNRENRATPEETQRKKRGAYIEMCVLQVHLCTSACPFGQAGLPPQTNRRRLRNLPSRWPQCARRYRLGRAAILARAPAVIEAGEIADRDAIIAIRRDQPNRQCHLVRPAWNLRVRHLNDRPHASTAYGPHAA